MPNEQRAHDITMLYVKLLSKAPEEDTDGNFKIDFYSKYKEVYPLVLEQINKDFPQ